MGYFKCTLCSAALRRFYSINKSIKIRVLYDASANQQKPLNRSKYFYYAFCMCPGRQGNRGRLEAVLLTDGSNEIHHTIKLNNMLLRRSRETWTFVLYFYTSSAHERLDFRLLQLWIKSSLQTRNIKQVIQDTFPIFILILLFPPTFSFNWSQQSVGWLYGGTRWNSLFPMGSNHLQSI